MAKRAVPFWNVRFGPVQLAKPSATGLPPLRAGFSGFSVHSVLALSSSLGSATAL